MSGAIESTVNAALALQNQNVMQEKNALMLRKVIDNQVNAAADIIESIQQVPELATSGTVGTQLHTTA